VVVRVGSAGPLASPGCPPTQVQSRAIARSRVADFAQRWSRVESCPGNELSGHDCDLYRSHHHSAAGGATAAALPSQRASTAAAAAAADTGPLGQHHNHQPASHGIMFTPFELLEKTPFELLEEAGDVQIRTGSTPPVLSLDDPAAFVAEARRWSCQGGTGGTGDGTRGGVRQADIRGIGGTWGGVIDGTDRACSPISLSAGSLLGPSESVGEGGRRRGNGNGERLAHFLAQVSAPPSPRAPPLQMPLQRAPSEPPSGPLLLFGSPPQSCPVVPPHPLASAPRADVPCPGQLHEFADCFFGEAADDDEDAAAMPPPHAGRHGVYHPIPHGAAPLAVSMSGSHTLPPDAMGHYATELLTSAGASSGGFVGYVPRVGGDSLPHSGPVSTRPERQTREPYATSFQPIWDAWEPLTRTAPASVLSWRRVCCAVVISEGTGGVALPAWSSLPSHMGDMGRVEKQPSVVHCRRRRQAAAKHPF
jgi:hypothetical protein